MTLYFSAAPARSGRNPASAPCGATSPTVGNVPCAALSDREHRLVMIASLIALNRADDLESELSEALRIHIGKAEILELIAQVASAAGDTNVIFATQLLERACIKKARESFLRQHGLADD